jgi:hypothetical protein
MVLEINSDYFPNGINRVVFVMEMQYSMCEVRNEFLLLFRVPSGFEGLRYWKK